METEVDGVSEGACCRKRTQEAMSGSLGFVKGNGKPAKVLKTLQVTGF